MKKQNPDAPRRDNLKFRVNTWERAKVEALAIEAELPLSDYLRALVGLPALRPGAPPGNQNKAGKKGANQHTKKESR